MKPILKVALSAAILAVVCAVVAVGDGLTGGSAQASQAAPSQYGPLQQRVNTEVSQAQLDSCIAESETSHVSCESQVPSLAKCMAAGEQCNRAAWESRLATAPYAQPPAAGQSVISQAQAIEGALKLGSGMGASISANTKANAQQLSMQAADTLLGQDSDPAISADRPVWVVSVAADVSNQLAPPGSTPVIHPYFTVVLDGYSGAPIESGLGVNALNVPTS